jgi:drug/metabolite transporter (DMT)-like permease
MNREGISLLNCRLTGDAMSWFAIAFISAVLSAASAVSQKKVLFSLSALEFSFFVSLLNILFAVPFFFSFNIGAISPESIVVLFIKSIMGALAFYNVMLALKNLDISGALPLLVLTPGIVALFAFLFGLEKLTIIQLSGMFLLLTGTYLLEMKPKQAVTEPFKIFSRSANYHYIGYALLFFSASSILDKVLLGNYKMPPGAFMAFQQVFYALVIGVIYFLSKAEKRNPFASFDKKIWFWLILIAALTAGYRYTQIKAVKIAPVSLVLSVKRISVFIAVVVGGHLFNEKNLLKKALATAIMVAGAIMIMEEG